MNIGKTLFAQLIDFLQWTTFARYVARYWRRQAGSLADLRGTVPGHGLLATELSREPARHRSVPVGSRRQSLPHGLFASRFGARRSP